MNNHTSSGGLKLTTVIFAVVVMAIAAMFSGNSTAVGMNEVSTEQINSVEE